MMNAHTIEARTHGRYLVDCPTIEGPPDKFRGRRFPLLVGLHGYAENADRMLDALVRIRGTRQWLLVSVQALNRFYNRGNHVVASWMTREDREQAIEDNIEYVTSIVDAVRRDYPATETIVYAGFSQGVAMAYRAASASRARGVIVLAGDVPPDVAPVIRLLPPVLIGRGAADGWYTEAKAAADLRVFADAGIQPTMHVFEGGHMWDTSFISEAGDFLDRIVESRQLPVKHTANVVHDRDLLA
jgi:predicted esterase